MKLSARGRTVLATVSHTVDLPDPGFVQGEVVVGSGRKCRTDVALLSDGTTAIKRSFLKPDGKLDHSPGWKVKGKLKEDARATLKADSPALIAQWVRQYVAKGWTEQ